MCKLVNVTTIFAIELIENTKAMPLAIVSWKRMVPRFRALRIRASGDTFQQVDHTVSNGGVEEVVSAPLVKIAEP